SAISAPAVPIGDRAATASGEAPANFWAPFRTEFRILQAVPARHRRRLWATVAGPMAFAAPGSGLKAMGRAFRIIPLFGAVRTKESQPGITGVVFSARLRGSSAWSTPRAGR